jgi:hypothetical protein
VTSESGPLQTFSKGYQLAKRLSYLAALPFLLDIVSLTGMYLSSENLYSFRIGAKFSLPFYFPSLTNVYPFPSAAGPPTDVPNFGGGLLAPTFAVLFTAVLGFLSAGYLGKIQAAVSGSDSTFAAAANKYFVRLFAYGLVWLFLAFLVLLFAEAVSLAFLYVASLFVLTYFIFLTPFAVVAENCGLAEAFSRSVKITTSQASRVLPFVVVYALATLVVSVPVYLLLNLSIFGFFLAVAGFAFVGTALVASTSFFYYELTRPTVQSPIERHTPLQQ